MKAVALFLVCCVFQAQGARPETQESLKDKRDKKLKSPFLSKAAWITDFDKALEESKKSGKRIFAYFTRSYAY